MKCTDCNRPIRPVVAVDIDGTLGDYHGHFKRFAENYVGRKLATNQDSLRYPYSVEFNDWLELEKEEYRQIKLAYRQGGMKRSMPLYSLSASLIKRLRQIAEVWLATTRPWLRLDNIDPDTRAWLDRHNIKYDGLLYGEDKYQRLIEIVGRERIVAVYDDLPEECDQARELGLSTLMAVTSHDSLALRDPIIRGHFDATEYLAKRITEWNKEHSSSQDQDQGLEKLFQMP